MDKHELRKIKLDRGDEYTISAKTLNMVLEAFSHHFQSRDGEFNQWDVIEAHGALDEEMSKIEEAAIKARQEIEDKENDRIKRMQEIRDRFKDESVFVLILRENKTNRYEFKSGNEWVPELEIRPKHTGHSKASKKYDPAEWLHGSYKNYFSHKGSDVLILDDVIDYDGHWAIVHLWIFKENIRPHD